MHADCPGLMTLNRWTVNHATCVSGECDVRVTPFEV